MDVKREKKYLWNPLLRKGWRVDEEFEVSKGSKEGNKNEWIERRKSRRRWKTLKIMGPYSIQNL